MVFHFGQDGSFTEASFVPSIGQTSQCVLSGTYVVSGSELTLSSTIASATGAVTTITCDVTMGFSNGGNSLTFTPAYDGGPCTTTATLQRMTNPAPACH